MVDVHDALKAQIVGHFQVQPHPASLALLLPTSSLLLYTTHSLLQPVDHVPTATYATTRHDATPTRHAKPDAV